MRRLLDWWRGLEQLPQLLIIVSLAGAVLAFGAASGLLKWAALGVLGLFAGPKAAAPLLRVAAGPMRRRRAAMRVIREERAEVSRRDRAEAAEDFWADAREDASQTGEVSDEELDELAALLNEVDE